MALKDPRASLPLAVTGLTGLVGRALVQAAAQRGVELRGLVRGAGTPTAGIDWRKVEFVDGDGLVEALRGTAAVVHLAAQTGAAADDAFRETNVHGTQRMLDAARAAGVSRFVFVSTIAVEFGNLDSYPYARSKLDAEALVRGSGLDWMIVRPTLVLGPSAPNLDKLAALASLPVVPLLGSGRARLQPIADRDLAELLLDAAESGGGRTMIEVGGPEVVTMKELLLRIRNVKGSAGGLTVPVPLFPVRLAVGMVGAVLGERSPVTAAQLSSFSEDAVATPSEFVQARSVRFEALDRTLARCLLT